MSQTSIDTFFKNRKRPASELKPSAKTITRKLFAQDSGPSSPIRSPVKHVVKESERNEGIVCGEKLIEEQVKVRHVPITRKLFMQDNGPTSSVRPPVEYVVKASECTEDIVREEKPVEEQVEETAREGCNETYVEGSEKECSVSTPTRSAAEQERLQKELNLGEFKKLVRQSKKYTSLKTNLEKHNATVSRLKTIEHSLKKLTSSAELKKFSNVEFEVHSSPIKQGNLKPRKLFGNDTSSRSPSRNQSYVSPRKLLDEGPVTSPVKPAFERYRHLLADGNDLLILPPKYVTLKDVFNGVETVAKILTDRKEMVTFKRIRNDVQKMTRRNFTEQHMGMIKAIYPEAYELKYEYVKLPFSREETLELIIEKNASHCSTTERKKMFDKLLLEKTKRHHQEFLKTLDPPLDVPVQQITRWHPLFDLNSVPDIPVAPIPRPAVNKDAPVSVKEFLEKTKQLVSCNKRVERAVSQLMEGKLTLEVEKKTELKNESISGSSPVVNPIPALQKALKGVPKSLLEKIRAKKAAKMVETITQTPEKAKEQAMLSRLPELAKIMRLVFVNEKKGILPEDLVLTKVSHSFKEKMSKAELIEHVKLISKHVPGWLNFCTVRNVLYIRLSKDADMSRIVGRLQKLTQPV